MITTVTHKEIVDVLMEPRAKGVKESYYVIDGDDQNITIVNPGKNGIEFNKTHGHVHNFLGPEIYQCLFGQGVIVMQRNSEDGGAKEFKVITLHPGKQVEVPAGFSSTMVNIGKGYLVVLDHTYKASKFRDNDKVKNKRGLAYYIVEKKGEIAFDVNPNYSYHPQISSE